MKTKNYYITIDDVVYSDKPSAILKVVETFIPTISTSLDIGQLMRFENYLIALRDLKDEGIINGEFGAIKVTQKERDTNKIASKIEKGYVFSTDLPKTFYINLNSAKVELLFEVLDTYIQMNRLTNSIRQELVEDLSLLIRETEPYIAGCGQIIEVTCK